MQRHVDVGIQHIHKDPGKHHDRIDLALVGFRTLLGDRLPRLLKKVQNEVFGQNLKLFKLF